MVEHKKRINWFLVLVVNLDRPQNRTRTSRGQSLNLHSLGLGWDGQMWSPIR